MQASRYEDIETHELKLRLELHHGKDEAKLAQRLAQRAEQLKRQGEEMVATVHLRKKKSDPKRFRRARRSR
jgi:hypothetical protein